MRVYLAGPINNCGDDECRRWRLIARTRLESEGHAVVDPMDRDYRGRELAFGQARRIVESDLNAIDGCDTVLIYTDRASWGTACEMQYAYGKRKDIRLVWESDDPLSPWPLFMATKVYRWLYDALEDMSGRKAA